MEYFAGYDLAALNRLVAGTLNSLPYLQRLAATRAQALGFPARFGFGGFWIAIPEQGYFSRMPTYLTSELRRAGFVRAAVNGVIVWGHSPVPLRMDQESRIQQIAAGMPGLKARLALQARALGAIVNWYGSPPGAAIYDGPVFNGLTNIGGKLPPTLRRQLETAGFVPQTLSNGTVVWKSGNSWTVNE